MSASPHRVLQSLCALLALVPCTLLTPVRTAAATPLERVPRRLLLYLPDPLAADPLLRFSDLGPRLRAPGAPFEILGAPDASRLLRDHGAVGIARLDDGVPAGPPEWNGWHVVTFDPPLEKPDAARLAARLRQADPRLRAEVDAVYEVLAVEELARSLRSGREPGRAPGEGRSKTGASGNAAFLPDDPLFVDGTQWGLHNEGTGPWSGQAGLDVRAPGAWAITTGNSAIRIAALDTGIDDTHPDLVRTLSDGSSRLAYKGEVTGDGSGGKDTRYHGTSVFGVMAALTNNGASLEGLGVAGVMGGSGGDSTGARILSIKITKGSEGTATGADMARAIVDAHYLGARAVNLSFAADEPSEAVRAALAFVADRGTTVVCGAGNGANSVLQYPGSYSRFGLTLSVGAMAPDGSLAVFSTRGEQVDVVAPGQDVATTWLTYANDAGSPIRNYQAVSGTSFAAPFVTGTLGLVAARQAELRANDAQEVVRRTARDWGAPGRDSLFGSGLLDAEALLRRLSAPYALERGTAAATGWSSVGRESLAVLGSGIQRGAHGVDGDYEADVWEVRAAVSGLVRLLEPPEAWARYTGPGGWSRGRTHEYDYAWGELVPGSQRSDGFELRTFVYYVDQPPPDCPSCPAVGWLPRPPEEVAMDWTAWSRFDAPPALTVLEPESDAIWTAGETRAVRWQASDPDRVTRVEVAWLAEGTATLLASSPDSAGAAQLTVPCRAGARATRLRVTAYDEIGLALDETSVEVPVQLAGEACGGAALFLATPQPNPSRGTVRFPYWVPDWPDAAPRLRVLDLRGREVARLSIDARGVAGEANWSGVDGSGRVAPSGIYWAVLEGFGERRTTRFTWLR